MAPKDNENIMIIKNISCIYFLTTIKSLIKNEVLCFNKEIYYYV